MVETTMAWQQEKSRWGLIHCLTQPHVVPVPGQDLDFQRHSVVFFVFDVLRPEVFVRFVDASGIVDHYNLHFLS